MAGSEDVHLHILADPGYAFRRRAVSETDLTSPPSGPQGMSLGFVLCPSGQVTGAVSLAFHLPSLLVSKV